ncbi:MAG: hypothetical protein A3A97_02025 [Candidatus Terrybacteria bacterium RIFCSPLOWO2_01_FULL_40_23]|uniref:Phosphatidic acid phosphatase type 2/haloperoxidase domain-containing protein n=1 Tax=Candidatus Terrybacteria bacterium RIFCSPLOWO2_01_FULL_40_23 TaxID=1802366 RepID=A0A1G2PSF1_9BACT|nr:MAG: hypothetical protein A3A97_02025 [Candidatus Terrybacteria bacterium RIFCSPLOWO2_01_FULL_40_23]
MDLLITHYLYYNIAHRNPTLDFMIFLSAEIFPYVFALGIWAWFLIRKRSRQVIFIGLVGLASAFVSRFIIVTIVRFFVERSRPFAELDLTPVFSHDPSNSFPSGHAAFFFALIPVMLVFSKKAGLIFSVIAIAMALSRVIAGVHWFSDVLVGGLIGLFIGHILMILYIYRYSSKI